MFLLYRLWRMYAPTQCTALTIAMEKIDAIAEYLNDFYPGLHGNRNWRFRWDKFHFDNDTEIVRLANKLFQVVASKDAFKQALADLTLKELFIRIMQMQNLLHLNTKQETNDSEFSYVKDFIKKNLISDITVEML